MKNSIAILAAGLGTRMKSPNAKVLQKLCGKSMILHILQKAFALSDDVSVILAHQKEQISAEILKHFPQTQILEQDLERFPGTAGALRGLEPRYERALILCGDMPLVGQKSLENLLSSEAELGLAVFEARDAKSYGRVVLCGGSVERIVEFKDASSDERAITICNAGVYALNSGLLRELLPLIENNNNAGEYYLTDIVKLARARDAKIQAIFVDEDEFMGINDKLELSRAENLLQEKIRSHWMREGVILRNPSSIFIGADVEFVGECEVQENVRIEGASRIIRSLIKSSSVIEESIVEDSDVGPLAHLRPHCVLKNAHIGNFVECKNAKLTGAKAGHLSYLGDCEVGEGSNIGCGTITCNYDGVKKHKTLIGKRVFVGSDTQFIAPVKVEDEVIIAAGSTVSEDVPSGALFINRAPASMVQNFYHKKFKK